jgi:hypothetical protein
VLLQDLDRTLSLADIHNGNYIVSHIKVIFSVIKKLELFGVDNLIHDLLQDSSSFLISSYCSQTVDRTALNEGVDRIREIISLREHTEDDMINRSAA